MLYLSSLPYIFLTKCRTSTYNCIINKEYSMKKSFSFLSILFTLLVASSLFLTSCSTTSKVFKSDTREDFDGSPYHLEFNCYKNKSWECVRISESSPSTIIFSGTYTGNVNKDTSETNKVIFKTTSFYSQDNSALETLPSFLQKEEEISITKGKLDWDTVFSTLFAN